MVQLVAPGTVNENSANIVVAASDVVKVGLFATVDGITDHSERATVWEVTPGAPNFVVGLSSARPSVRLLGPSTYYVQRLVGTQSLGVYKE